jgi:hypothetical protein
VEELGGAGPPWRRGIPCTVRETDAKKDDPVARQLEMARACVEEAGDVDHVLYTDDSAEGRVTRRGGGVVVYGRGELAEEWSVTAGKICSSYSPEVTAMEQAMEWLRRSAGWSAAAVVTDSLALVKSVQGGAK